MEINIVAEPHERYSPEAIEGLVGQVVIIDVDGRPVGRYVVQAAESTDGGQAIRVSLSAKTS